MNIRESVNKYLEGVTSVEQLNRKVISESVGCSVYQVGRQAGDLVRAKKDSLNSLKASNKAKKSNSAKDKLSESSGFDLLIKELGKINKRLDSIESKVNKIKKDDWIDYNLNAPPRGTKIKVKITGEGIRVGYTENFDWGTYDHEHDREDVRVCNLWNDYQHDQAYSATMNIIEDKYPKSVDYDLSRSAGYNGICEDDEVYDLFNKMSSDYQNIMSSEKENYIIVSLSLFMKNILERQAKTDT